MTTTTDRPICKCHDEEMTRKGPRWTCSVRNREATARWRDKAIEENRCADCGITPRDYLDRFFRNSPAGNRYRDEAYEFLDKYGHHGTGREYCAPCLRRREAAYRRRALAALEARAEELEAYASLRKAKAEERGHTFATFDMVRR